MIHRFLVFLLTFSGIAVSAGAQPVISGDTIVARFDRQVFAFPQEKIHLQSDKNHYISGETIWFRAFLVDALTHRPDTASRYVYVELLSPADSLVARYKIVHRQGVFSGYIPLAEGIPGGDYSLRAYTRYMTQGAEDYFFRKPIRISDPIAATVRTEASFTPADNGRRIDLDLFFRPVYGEGKALPQSLRLWVDGTEREGLRIRPDSTAGFSFRTEDPGRKNMLLIDYDRHRQYLEIPPAPEQFDVSFFPEGGYLIADRPMQVGVKALKSNGGPEAVRGEIRDQQGQLVAGFDTAHAGIGVFRFIPLAGATYTAHCTNSAGCVKTFPLPDVRDDAVSLQVLRTRGMLAVRAFSGSRIAPQSYTLVVQSRGIVFHCAPLPAPDSPVWIDPASLVSGVNHFLLLDPAGQIVSERLVFVLNDDRPTLSFETDRAVYARRDSIHASFSLRDRDGAPLTGNFSVAVTDDTDIPVDSAYTILSSLLLDSELRGRIDEPGYYFRNDPEAGEAADALMLTQGWRRYDVPALLRGEIRQPGLRPEQFQQITGSVKRPVGSRGAADAPVYAISTQHGFMEVTGTDEDGRFRFPPMEFPDSTRFVVQGLSRRGSAWVELSVDMPTWPELTLSYHAPLLRQREQTEISHYVEKADQQWSLENGMRTVYLDAVSVTANKRQTGGVSVYQNPVDVQSYLSSDFESQGIYRMEQVMYQAHGIRMDMMTGRLTARWLGKEKPVFVFVNDMLVGDPIGPFDIRMIDLETVARVDVSRNMRFPGSGTQGAAAIMIYLKEGHAYGDRAATHMKTIDPLGYQEPVEFYSPKYPTARQRSDRQKPDLRTTLYWNPAVPTDERGRAAFDFYAADAATTYSVVIEGVTDDGRIVRSVESIVRE